jgi:hypothetical protein
MSLAALFAGFGAPLANTRWSWGSVRPDGTVFLRVWTDEMKTVDGRRYVRLINRRAYAGDQDNLGFAERRDHVRMLADGASGYAVLCRAAEPRARSREIVSFDDKTIFRLGALAIFDGDEWGEVVERVPARSIT